ncbi:MAG: MarR family transcriptional regulator [Spirochaetales bacterium]
MAKHRVVHSPTPAEIAQFREQIRSMERKLGLLQQVQFGCCGLTLSQCHTLVEIGHNQPISLNALAGCLGLDKSTLSRSVDSLVSRGYVERLQSLKDRRSLQISLTETGTRIFQTIEDTMNQQFRKILESLPSRKRKQVLQSLNLLLEILPDLNCCGE